MFKSRVLIASLLAFAFLASTPADAWRHQMRSTVTAEKNSERHRREIEHSFAVPSPNEESTWICAAYGRNFVNEVRNQGNNKVVLEIHRFMGSFENEAEVETMTVRGKIQNNRLVACDKTNKPLDKNDVILARHVFNKAPRMKSEDKEEPARFRVWTSISSVKQDLDDFFPPPPVVEPDDTGNPDPDPGPDPGPDDGGGDPDPGPGPSSSDRVGVEKMRGCASTGVGVQFRWEGGRIWIDRRAPGGSVTSAGPFPSLAAAGNDAQRRWNCGGGNSVSTADAGQLPRLLAWGGAGGGRLLALRFERGGGAQVYVDAYHSSIGAIHGSAFGTVEGAIRNFCGRSNVSC